MCIKNSDITGSFTFLKALKYPQKQEVNAINGSDSARIIITLGSTILFNNTDTNSFLNNIVNIHTQIDIIAQNLQAILEEQAIFESFFNISLSETILVIASGIPNSDIVTKKLNKFIINE